MLQIEQAAPILGKGFMDRMTSKDHAVLQIGNEFYTRHQLVTQIGTGNFRAARILHEACRQLKVNSVKDLYALSPYELASVEGLGIGTTTMFVLIAFFAFKGLDWRKWYGLGRKEHVSQFEAMKHTALRRDRAAEKEAKRTLRRKQLAPGRARAKAAGDRLLAQAG